MAGADPRGTVTAMPHVTGRPVTNPRATKKPPGLRDPAPRGTNGAMLPPTSADREDASCPPTPGPPT
ncbi:hypothetical protein ACFPM0_34660 [Pseudonocardia sulfidoxydans]|uniref:hypothetical protein n=1 Tax=Pseudonocardia sulfidoxydans TaxID=54011 RepID=UPI0036192198